MITFVEADNTLILVYKPDDMSPHWVLESLRDSSEVTISKCFYFKSKDVISPEIDDKLSGDESIYFKLGKLQGNYYCIPGRILSINNNLFMDKKISFERKLFIAERQTSIFRRLASLLGKNTPIVIGGNQNGAIPINTFNDLIKNFPNTTELNHYANSRVYTILAQYLDGMKDAKGKYEAYLNRKTFANLPKLDLDDLNQYEIEKYTLIRDMISDALVSKKNWSEKDWQKMMVQFIPLLFPKYIMVLQNVTINDYYSKPGKKTSRYIDVALVDASGNIDVIEVKKPFDDKILSGSLYRGNSIPALELSGGIMQAEKYLFHLSKWGLEGEKTLTKKYQNNLPAGMSIRISNPKAIIIAGRDKIKDSDMNDQQKLDFEIIKRKYAKMIDIITYDDLLKRLDNTIAALKK